jgi:putative Mn2+ efflux pump MntP
MKLFALILIALSSQMGQAMACAVCFGARGSQTSEHMAIAIWILLGAVMSVLGGVGAFSFHLWRHARMPLEPHQELTEENFSEYD